MEHDEPSIAALAAAVEPASQAHADAVRARLGAAATAADQETIELAARLAAIQRGAPPPLTHKRVVVCAADHGITAGREVQVDGGLGLLPGAGATRAALRHLATGEAAVHTAARAAGASLVLVDCGVRGSGELGAGVLELRVGAETADIRAAAAMSRAQAAGSVRTGMALLLSLAESGLDAVGLGQLAIGARPISSALVAALTGADPGAMGPGDSELVAAALRAGQPDPARPLDALAALGGFDIGVLAGVVLAACSLRIPVVLDDHGTAAAALLAARWQPAITGYLFAAHPGTAPAQRHALRALGLAPIYGQAISHGEGAGAAMALALLDGLAELAKDALS